MKSFHANLVTALGKEVLTISTLWRMTRTDGVVLRYTDHDRDVLLELDVSAPDTFERFSASTGFSRSTLVQKSDFSVDDTTIEGIKTKTGALVAEDTEVTDEDLRAGRYDHALVEIFIVDYTGPKESEVGELRKGRIGQMRMGKQKYQTEHRGLTQALAVEIGDVYSPTCRLDLFSPSCGLTASQFEQAGMVAAITSGREFAANLKDLKERTPVPLPVPDDPDPLVTDRQDVVVNEDGTLVREDTAPDGTEDFPFLLTDAAGVDAIRSDPTAHYALTQDVNMVSLGGYLPIPIFQGTLDGRGFKLTNLDIIDPMVVTEASHGGWGFIATLGQRGVVKRLGIAFTNIGVGAGSDVPQGAFCGRVLGTIEDCWAEGTFNLLDNNAGFIGGFAGHLQRNPSEAVGEGVADEARPATIRRCWCSVAFLGTVVPARHGGFLGRRDDTATEEETYFDSDVAGDTSTGSNTNSTALTTVNAQLEASYPGFDFDSHWKSDDGVDYPRHLDPGRDAADPLVRFAAVDLTPLGTYSAGDVSWTSLEPGLSAIAVAIATDGETFVSTTNGGPLPGFSASQSLVGVVLTVRVEFQTLDANLPTLTSLTMSVESENDSFPDVAAGPPPPVPLEPSDAEWFAMGQVTWITGRNAGLSMEVKDWIPGSRTFKLYLPMQFPIAVGDEFVAAPGCKHRIVEDCAAKYANTDQAEAEPFVPGEDVLFNMPDSQTGGGTPNPGE